jgi:hypothetical protein
VLPQAFLLLAAVGHRLVRPLGADGHRLLRLLAAGGHRLVRPLGADGHRLLRLLGAVDRRLLRLLGAVDRRLLRLVAADGRQLLRLLEADDRRLLRLVAADGLAAEHLPPAADPIEAAAEGTALTREAEAVADEGARIGEVNGLDFLAVCGVNRSHTPGAMSDGCRSGVPA